MSTYTERVNLTRVYTTPVETIMTNDAANIRIVYDTSQPPPDGMVRMFYVLTIQYVARNWWSTFSQISGERHIIDVPYRMGHSYVMGWAVQRLLDCHNLDAKASPVLFWSLVPEKLRG